MPPAPLASAPTKRPSPGPCGEAGAAGSEAVQALGLRVQGLGPWVLGFRV